MRTETRARRQLEPRLRPNDREIDTLLDLGQIRGAIAQVEVAFSNSLIEAFWRSPKLH